MLVFSEMLKSFISENKISVKKLATELQMDRTLIQKYMSGSRLPKSYHEVEKISQGMLLLPGQQKDLLEAYYREAYGTRNFESYMKIKEVMEGVQNFQIEPAMDIQINDRKMYEQSQQGFEEETKLRGTKIICGRMAVQYVFSQLVQATYANWNDSERLKIRMIIQPEQEDFIRLVLGIVSQKDVSIDHIFCMDKNGNDNDNIARIFSILTFILGKKDYQACYYYDNVRFHINETTLLPNLILVGENAMLCNYTMDQGMLVFEKEAVSFLKTQYESIRALARKLDMERQSMQNMVMASAAMLRGKDCVAFSYFPGIALSLNREMLEEHLLLKGEEKEIAIHSLEEMLLLMKSCDRYRNYFSEQGLRKFMENGTILDYPDQIYLKPDMKQRLRILDCLIKYIKSENYQAYMVDENKFSMDMNILIAASEDGNVMFWCRDSGYGRTVQIKEKTISNSVFGFEKFALENDWVYDREATLERMEWIYREYSEV